MQQCLLQYAAMPHVHQLLDTQYANSYVMLTVYQQTCCTGSKLTCIAIGA